MTTTVIPAFLDLQAPAFLAHILTHARKYALPVQTYCVPLATLAKRAKRAKIWEQYFPEEPKTWERFAIEVFGVPAGFLDAIIEGVAILDTYRAGKPVPAREQKGGERTQ